MFLKRLFFSKGANNSGTDLLFSEGRLASVRLTWCIWLSLPLLSSSTCPRAIAHQPQPHRYPGVMVAVGAEADPWPCFSVSPVVPGRLWGNSHPAGAVRRPNTAPPGGPAARHRLPPEDCCLHQRGLGRTLCLDLPQDAKDLQQRR